MAIWGIGTGTETAENNYNIPKHLSEADRTNTPHNCFADQRGWVYRRYGTTAQSGLSTSYYDEVLVPVSGLNTTGISSTRGLGVADPTAIFFEDPNLASPISLEAGGTSGIKTGVTGYVNLVFNENVYVSAGATVKINISDPLDVAKASILGYASSVAAAVPVYNFVNGQGYTEFVNYNGQITNRVAFGFTAPTTLYTANVPFGVTTLSSLVASGASIIPVGSVSGVAIGSSVSVGSALFNAPIVSVGSTTVTIAAASTVASTLSAGVAVTFSTRTTAAKLRIDTVRAFAGVITDFSGGVGVTSTYTSNLIRNVGGAGSTPTVGIGTTTLTVTA
jgi:hypothetical protein